MKSVIIHLVRPKGAAPILSSLIMKAEGTNFSHVAVSWHLDSIDRDIFYQSVGSGVNFISKYNFNNHYQIVNSYEFLVEDIKSVAQFCHDNSGNPYGKLQLVGLGIMRFCKLLGITITNPFKTGSASQVCLETGMRVLIAAGCLSILEDQIDNYDLIGFKALLDKYGKKV